jgi:hypothetical protein
LVNGNRLVNVGVDGNHLTLTLSLPQPLTLKLSHTLSFTVTSTLAFSRLIHKLQ